MNLSANSIQKQINNLSLDDRQIVANLIYYLNKSHKKKKNDWLGIISLKFVDWFSSKSKLTDDEVDEYIKSVRVENREHRN